MLQTQFDFNLPCGYVDERGSLQRRGVMRRAFAIDEIEPLNDPRVQSNEAFLTILLLSRVITRLGDITTITPDLIMRLFATDFIYLQELYTRVNAAADSVVETECPQCGKRFMIDLADH